MLVMTYTNLSIRAHTQENKVANTSLVKRIHTRGSNNSVTKGFMSTSSVNGSQLEVSVLTEQNKL